MVTEEVAKVGAAMEPVTRPTTSPQEGVYRGYETDVLSQFKANLNQVEDSHARLRFVLSEVQSLLKK